MNNSRDRRVARLERAKRAKEPRPEDIYVWRHDGESTEEAIAKRCPEGVPPGARLVVVSWMTNDAPAPAAAK